MFRTVDDWSHYCHGASVPPPEGRGVKPPMLARPWKFVSVMSIFLKKRMGGPYYKKAHTKVVNQEINRGAWSLAIAIMATPKGTNSNPRVSK